MSEVRTVSVSLDFEIVNDKIQPTSGGAQLNGVPTGIVCDTLLTVMEELLFHEVAEIPKVQKLLEFSPVAREDGSPWPLEERTQRLVVKLLAHQMLLSRVASRKYAGAATSARLSLPYDG